MGLEATGRNLLYTIQGNPAWKSFVGELCADVLKRQALLSGIIRAVPGNGYDFGSHSFTTISSSNVQLDQILTVERSDLVKKIVVFIRKNFKLSPEELRQIHIYLEKKSIVCDENDTHEILTLKLRSHLIKVANNKLKNPELKKIVKEKLVDIQKAVYS